MRRIADAARSACLFLLLAAAAAGSDSADSSPVMAVILHTNDVHGHFAASDRTLGHDRVAAIFRDVRRRVPAALLLDAGDAAQGAPLVKWNRGEAAVEIMNAAAYDGMTLGNHEFDYGWDATLRLAALADFPVFTQPVVSGGEKGFEAAAVFERGGRRIGVFGLTTPETKQASAGGAGREFGSTEEILAYAGAMAHSLRRAGAEIVVCLAHLGVDPQGFITSYDVRDGVDGIDLIVDGHSHTPLADIVQADGRALVVSAGEHAQALGLVEFRCEGGRLRPFARSIAWDEAADFAPDPAVAAVVAKWVGETNARGSRVLARTSAEWSAERAVVRVREAGIGNAITDAMREATGADAAMLNGGGIRSGLPAGDVTVNDFEAVLPFDMTVRTARVRGGVIGEALELSVSRHPSEFGGFLQLSGIVLVFDAVKPAGRRVVSVSIGGEPLDADRFYSLSLCDWIAGGGDGYGMFVEPFRGSFGAGAPLLVDVFADYLNRRGGGEPAVEGRIAAQVPSSEDVTER